MNAVRRRSSFRCFLCCAVAWSAVTGGVSRLAARAPGQTATDSLQNPAGSSSLDDQLFRDLGGLRPGDGATESVNPARSAPPVSRDRQTSDRQQAVTLQQMLQVRTRLSRADAGAETQRIQSEILTQLEQWLALQGGSSSAAGAPADGARPDLRIESVDRTPRGSVPRSDANAEDRATTAAGELPRRLLQRAWGNLPASMRQQLQSVGQEQFLPKYAPQIEAYYRSLSASRAKDR